MSNVMHNVLMLTLYCVNFYVILFTRSHSYLIESCKIATKIKVVIPFVYRNQFKINDVTGKSILMLHSHAIHSNVHFINKLFTFKRHLTLFMACIELWIYCVSTC